MTSYKQGCFSSKKAEMKICVLNTKRILNKKSRSDGKREPVPENRGHNRSLNSPERNDTHPPHGPFLVMPLFLPLFFMSLLKAHTS